MAEIKPMRAWRYAAGLPYTIESLTAPLFDVVSPQQREQLLQIPYNSIHLTSPGHSTSFDTIAERLNAWKNKGVIVQDKLPGIYVYYQYFTLPGSKKIHCQKGFMAYIRVYDWQDNVMLRHEDTIPEIVKEQVDLLDKTQFHFSATHGLYTDEDLCLESWMDEAIHHPVYTIHTDRNIKGVLSIIHDAKIIHKFIEVLKNKKILLMDGHHRYQGSIEYCKQKKMTNTAHCGHEAYNFHPICLSNTASTHFRILPTHRLLTLRKEINKETFFKELMTFFHVTAVQDITCIDKVIADKSYTLGFFFRGEAYSITLKPAWRKKISWDIPEIIKDLDVTVVHYFVFEKILKIPYRKQQDLSLIRFEQNLSFCVEQANKNPFSMVFIMRELPVEVFKKACYSGYAMPQKSTYFYPKLISGLLFASIEKNEFQTPDYFSIKQPS